MSLLPANSQSLRVVFELGLIYSLVQIYIWRWQSAWPRTVWLILLLLLASHLWHRDNFRSLGFRIDNFFPAARETCWVAIPLLLLLVLIGILSGHIWSIRVHWEAIAPLLRYMLWGLSNNMDCRVTFTIAFPG